MKIEDYTKYLSRRSARRQPSAIRAIAPLTTLPGMVDHLLQCMAMSYILLD